MNKKIVSIIMALTLTLASNSNVIATSNTSSSDALKQTQDNKKALQSKVEELNKQIDEVIQNIDNNKKSMNKIADEIKNTQIKLEAAENASDTQEELFKKRARAMYITGADSYLEVLLASKDLNDFISRVDMLTKVIDFDNRVVANLKEKKQAIENQKESLNHEKDKLEALRTSNESTLSKLNKNIKEQKELLSKTTEKEKQLLAMETENAPIGSIGFGGGSLSRGMSGSSSYSQVLSMVSTAYSDDGITASGAETRRDASGYSTIAVDPRVIPLGSRVYIEGYGYAIASDIGGAIQGNIIDVFFQSQSEALSWGRRSVKVYILN